MHDTVDLRSDTVTKPTPEMRRAMADAEVGDDVFGDDPTVLQLEDMAATRMGKEAALFMPSGTMANNVAIKVWTSPGDEVLMDRDAHSLCFEVGAPGAISGVVTREFHSVRGVPDLDDVQACMHTENLHSPGTALIVLENTHNRAGGAVIPLECIREVREIATERGAQVHIDGARIFNASVASGVPVDEYASAADSICFCLSKGLGCPVGSLLCGTREFVEGARRMRKRLGGGMRQVGVLAACGIVALNTMVDRLAEDHARARHLADGLCGLPGIEVDADHVETNMVYFDTSAPAHELCAALEGLSVRCNPTASHRVRWVTHKDIDDEDAERALEAMRTVTSAK